MADALEAALLRLECLLTALLILASGESTPVHEDVLLVPLIEDILMDLRPISSTQGVQVSYVAAEQLIVSGDPDLLRRAFQNLVENAIRCNRPGGTVTISMRRLDAGVVVEVAETGIGIPPTALPHIFERFYRVEQSRSRHRGGAGLGLALAREIARRHGGDILVESRLERQVGAGRLASESALPSREARGR